MERRTAALTLGPVVVGLAVLLTLLLVIGLAIRDPHPHGIAVGVSGPPAVVQQVERGFEAAVPGAFSFISYATADAARSAIDTREVAASLIIASDGPRLVVAGAAGDAVSGGVTGALTKAFRAQGQELAVETVHPFAPGDAHGVILFFVLLATLMSSILVGAMAVLAIPGRSGLAQAGVVTGYAILAGVVGTLAAGWLAGGYGQGTWSMVGLLALLSLAVGSALAAAARYAGPAGVVAGVLVALVGLVSSGGPLGTELLPDAYRAVAPWLPVAPAYDALRGALFFDGAGAVRPVLLLGTWAVLGCAALAAPGLARRLPAGVRVAHA